MSLQSGFNQPKYRGAGVATIAPDSMQGSIREALYNRLVSQPEQNVTLVEPIRSSTELHLDAIAVRYKKLTGIQNAVLHYHDKGFRAVIDTKTLRITGTGMMIGCCGIPSNGKVSDSFNLYQLENMEIMNTPSK